MSILLCALLIVLGVYMLHSHRFLIADGWRSRRWIAVRAEVIDSKDDSFSIPIVSHVSTAREARAIDRKYLFLYKVDGRSFTTENYTFGGYCDRAAANFMIGDEVTVYYDPKRPSEAVVRRGLRFSACFGIVLVLLGAYFLSVVLQNDYLLRE